MPAILLLPCIIKNFRRQNMNVNGHLQNLNKKKFPPA